MMEKNNAMRAVGVVAALLVFALPAMADDSLRVHFIDVGHGDCILIQTPDDGIPNNGRAEGYRIIIDAGEVACSHNYPLTYFKRLGLKHADKIDYAIATHRDADHVDGPSAIYDSFHALNTVEPGYEVLKASVKPFLTAARRESAEGSKSWRNPVESKLISKLGDTLKFGRELETRLLFCSTNPGKGRYDTRTNFSSIVLRVRYGSVSFLLWATRPRRSRNR